MSTTIRLGLALVILAAGTQGLAMGGEPAPVVLDGVEYQVEHEQDGPEGLLKASVKAIDPRISTVRWRVTLYEGTSRESWLPGVKNPRLTTLEAFAKGLVASTDDGATFFIDPATRKSELVQDRRQKAVECDKHHHPLEGMLVPIHYGMATGRPLTKEQRDLYPRANRPIEGGCCVMPEKAAIVAYCPDCR